MFETTVTETNPDITAAIAPPPVSAPKRVWVQDRFVAQEIARAETTLQVIQNDPALSARLATYGYPADKLAQGQALLATTQGTYNARLAARSTAIAAQRERARLWQSVQRTYADFRIAARECFAAADARSALGLDDPEPRAQAEFVTHARAAYDAALNTPAALTALTQYGFAQDVLQDAVRDLDRLMQAIAASVQAQADAVRATETRNEACRALTLWVNSMRRVARIATRGNREWRLALAL